VKPDFGSSFAPTFAGRPAHMSSVDFVLWMRLQHKGPLPFERLFFDVAVGEGAAAPGDSPANVRAAWQRISRPRIDVVGEHAAGWTLLELRGAAGPGAIGSLIVYRDLWLVDPPDDRPVELVLVTDVFPTNLELSLGKADIRLMLV
jgi:hypothetical protein